MPEPNPNQSDVVVDGTTEIDKIPEGVNLSDPGVKAYMEKMAEKAEQGTATNTNTGEDLLAGKYKSRDDLIKGINELNMKDMSDDDLVKMYKDLESGVGNQQSDEDAGSETEEGGDDGSEDNKEDSEDSSEDSEEPTEADSEENDETESEDSDDDTGTEAQVQTLIDQCNQELTEGDSISEESFAALEQVGISRSVAKLMVDGINAKKQALYDVVGSKEKYFEMLDWANENLSRGEIEAFNSSFDTDDLTQMKDQVQLVKIKYGKQNSLPPKKKVKPKGNAATTVQGFENKAAMTAAMRDPRYKTDPAYRKQVETKIAKTPWM